jgi:hypothetical protein
MVLLSATKMSPLGAWYIQRGFFRSEANLATVKPGGAVGVLPAGQPITLANFWPTRLQKALAG